MFKRLKDYFTTNVMCYKQNVFGYFCPDCALIQSNTSAFAESLWDEQYKKYKIFIRCNNCFNTTPAFESIEKAQDSWEDLFIKKEVELFKLA